MDDGIHKVDTFPPPDRIFFIYKIALIFGIGHWSSGQRRVISETGEDFWLHTMVTTPPAAPILFNLLTRRKKSALSFFFYIRERGKKNHRFSLRSTRRQLYESLPWSLDLRHISSDVLRTTPPPALSFVFYPLPTLSLPLQPPASGAKKKILFIS